MTFDKLSDLIHLPPLRVQVVVHMARRERLRSHPHQGVWVRLASDHALHEVVLGDQVLGFHQVDPHDALCRRKARNSDGKGEIDVV